MEIEKYQLLESTNSKAKQSPHQPWRVVWAEKQTAGYGREENLWFSPPGGLYFSIQLPKSTIEDLQTLTILAAFIVAKVIKESFSMEPFIKLPNDVYLNQKKIAGILTENVIGQDIKFSVMGIGLNTNIEKFPPELENTATSLKIESGSKVNNEKIMKSIVQELEKQLDTISQ